MDINEQEFTRHEMLERDNYDKIDYHTVRFVDLDDFPQNDI